MAQAAPPPVDEALQNAIREYIKERNFTLEKFRLYRNGDDRCFRDWDEVSELRDAGEPAHFNRIVAWRVPRLDYTGIFTDDKRRSLKALAELNRFEYGGARPGTRAVPWGVQRSARREYSRVGGAMNKAFRFVKYLAAGGQGMVSLWEWKPGGRRTYRFVMKISTMTTGGWGSNGPRADISGIRQENAWMTRLARAPHILQRFIFEDNLPELRSDRIAAENKKAAEALDGDDGALFMEFARYGDLHGMLHKSARLLMDQPMHVPMQAAWRFFDCLVKGLMAMDYPPLRDPAHFAPNTPADDPWAPTTVFLNDYDQPGPNGLVPAHTDTPKMQIADFGLAEARWTLWKAANGPGLTPVEIANRRLWKWNQRQMAKKFWFLPEQFSVDWETIALDPSTPNPPAPAAGNLNPPVNWPPWNAWPITSGPGRYTRKSNVWHVGMLMCCIMSFKGPPWPPFAGRMVRDEPAGVPYDQIPRRDQRWTYGYDLIDPDPNNGWAREVQRRYGLQLCEVVARCLMNKQEHRPDLQQLQSWITAELTPPPAGPVPPGSAAAPVSWGWKRLVLGDPPFPEAPWQLVDQNIKPADIDPFWDYARGRPR